MRTGLSLVSGACDSSPLRATGEGSSLVGTAGTERCLPPAVRAQLPWDSHLTPRVWVSTLLNTDQSPTWYFRSLGSTCVTH